MVTSTTFGSGEFGRGKTLVALTVVIGCFAVLWPKIFYPMLTSSLFPGGDGGGDLCCDVIFEKDTNAYKVMNEICAGIIQRESLKPPENLTSAEALGQGQQRTHPVQPAIQQPPKNKWYKNYTAPEQPTAPPPQPINLHLPTAILCRNEILKTCKIDVVALLNENPTMSKEYKESLNQLRSFNVSQCLRENYGVDLESIGLPKRFKNPESSPSHMRPERPIHMPQTSHPALREKGSAMPHPPRRTIEMEARPGPQPGIRPPMGGGLNTPPPRGGGGTMGIIMPLYTIGIVCFFLYTIFKILFRKSEEKAAAAKEVRVGDFAIDQMDRKYVLPTEYERGNNYSKKDPYYRDPGIGVRRRSSAGIAPIPSIPVVQDISVPSQIAPIAMASASSSGQVHENTNESRCGPKEHDAILTAMKGILAEIDKPETPKIEKTNAVLRTEKDDTTSNSQAQESPVIAVINTDLQKPGIQLKGQDDAHRKKEFQPKRPPTPIRLYEPEGSDESEEDEDKQIMESYELIQFAQELSALVIKQSLASAAVSLAFVNRKENVTTPAQARSQHHLKNVTADRVAVVGMDESVGLENGERWTDRTPTPTFSPRLNSPLPPHRPPTPPVEVTNIYLEGPIPTPANQVLISNSECEEIDMDEDYEYEDDEDYDSENDKPVVLSGKVTLSVLSGIGGGEDKTEAPSFSMDDPARANSDKPRFSGKETDVSGALANAIKDTNGSGGGNGSVPNVAPQQSKGSSPDMDEYEVVAKDGCNAGETEDQEATHYTTAEADFAQLNTSGEETSADISVMEGLHEDDEEYDEEEGSEEASEEESEEEASEEELSEEEEPKLRVPSSQGSVTSTPSPVLSSPPSPSPYGTYFTEP